MTERKPYEAILSVTTDAPLRDVQCARCGQKLGDHRYVARVLRCADGKITTTGDLSCADGHAVAANLAGDR